MRLLLIITACFVAIANAAPKPKYMENDKLADQGLANLKAYVAEHGYANPQKCTLKTARVRKEWYVNIFIHFAASLY
jgi:tyrosinase